MCCSDSLHRRARGRVHTVAALVFVLVDEVAQLHGGLEEVRDADQHGDGGHEVLCGHVATPQLAAEHEARDAHAQNRERSDASDSKRYVVLYT